MGQIIPTYQRAQLLRLAVVSQRLGLAITQSHALLDPCACTTGRRGSALTDENQRAVLHERLIMAGRGG